MATGGDGAAAGVQHQACWKKSKKSSNPKGQGRQKALSQDQTQLKASMLAVLDVVRDNPAKTPPCAWCSSPKGKKHRNKSDYRRCWPTPAWKPRPHQPHHGGPDGKPTQNRCARCWKSGSPSARPPSPASATPAGPQVLDYIHILEGRQTVLLNIDEVIAIIRQSDEPKAALILRFNFQRPAGRGHPRNPPAPAGSTAGSHQDRARAERAARKPGQARRHPEQPRLAAPHHGQRDRGKMQTVLPTHAAP